jgi:integrase
MLPDYALGKDPNTGTMIRAREVVEGTKKDAERKRTEMLRSLDMGSYVEPARETVREYLEHWLRDYVETHIDKPKTRRGYESIVRRHLIPALGHHKLARLTPALVQSYYTTTLTSGRLDAIGKPTGKPLSATTVAHHHAALHDALEFAVRLGLVARNVADAVDPPKIVGPSSTSGLTTTYAASSMWRGRAATTPFLCWR